MPSSPSGIVSTLPRPRRPPRLLLPLVEPNAELVTLLHSLGTKVPPLWLLDDRICGNELGLTMTHTRGGDWFNRRCVPVPGRDTVRRVTMGDPIGLNPPPGPSSSALEAEKSPRSDTEPRQLTLYSEGLARSASGGGDSSVIVYSRDGRVPDELFTRAWGLRCDVCTDITACVGCFARENGGEVRLGGGGWQ